ncbi:MAG TPA: ATP-binding protein [Verrucomicrobiae bacterium]
MNDANFQQAYAEQNRRDYITAATIGTLVCVPLNLLCAVMDHFVYPGQVWLFFKLRLISSLVTGLGWLWFRTKVGQANPRFGVMWFLSPLVMILLMIYLADDSKSSYTKFAPYYAGLNIIMLGMGLLTPWANGQNLLTCLFTMVMYVLISLTKSNATPLAAVINNTTFLLCTAVLVVAGSEANARQRFREFSLRFELDKNRRSLEETNRKLVELDQLKNRFFANISHELRTPLTLLLGPLEVLIKRANQTLDTQTRELLQTMQGNGMRLLKLINDLLELIRLESGRLEIKSDPLSMTEFVSGLGSAVRQMAREKNITFETRTDPALGVVLGDRDKLEKIILNLLFNALKFTPANGRVTFSATLQNGRLNLLVNDTGVGIEAKNLPYVFDRFWQADGSSKRKFQGVGIGLALVKELTELMHGVVTVQSTIGQGTQFTVSLPYRPAPADILAVPAPAAVANPSQSDEWLANLYRRAELFPNPISNPEADGSSAPVARTHNTTTFSRRSHKPLVLVADDEPDMRRFLTTQLQDEYEVVEAADGLQAAETAMEVMPDIILLDLMMPHKDGLQVCRELRDYAPTAGIPIILLTARADEEVKFDALQKGANDFLAKPFSSIELQARIKNLIESHHYQRKLTRQNQALNDAIEQIKETEMQLVQTEKLSSLGRMSAGIIHEINNPLNFAMTGLFALRSQARKLPDAERALQESILADIDEGLKRVKNIVSDLRQFTHPGGGTSEPVEVLEATDAAVRFLGGEWKDKVRILQQIPESQLIWANRNKLIHVLVNLMQNAIDALTEKQYPAGEKAEIRITGRTEGDRSLIIVRDNGPGIEKKIIDKVFDPFFTTKEVGKGMGLGLSICYRIVEGYGGRISVKSEPGQWCEFTLDFPANAEAATVPEMEAHGESIRL